MFFYLEFSVIGAHLFLFVCNSDAGSGAEEVELSWEDYLEETGATAVPYGSFKHVSSNCVCSSDSLLIRVYRCSKLGHLKEFECLFPPSVTLIKKT